MRMIYFRKKPVRASLENKSAVFLFKKINNGLLSSETYSELSPTSRK